MSKWRKQEEIDQINVDVERWLAEHQITCIVGAGPVRLWKCQKPGTWIYGFHVTIGPGGLLLSGDVGELLVQRFSDPDEMLKWTRSAVDSPSYLLSKVPNDLHRGLLRYCPEVKDRVAEDLRENYGERGAALTKTFLKAAEYAESADEVARAWYNTLRERGQCTADPPDFEFYTESTIAKIAILRWFVQRVVPN
jgi:hypothetical protein